MEDLFKSMIGQIITDVSNASLGKHSKASKIVRQEYKKSAGD